MTSLSSTSLDSFKSSIRGEIVLPDSSNFDEVRAIWNAMIDRRPAIIVQCTGTADVKACLAFAKAEKLAISIRGAGHNIAGNALRNDALLIDLSLLRSVTVDPAGKRVFAGPGATLGDIDHETKEFGLATPTGINSTTGISGLTLGGGIGWLTRQYGMTVDNVLSAEIVTADGEVLIASEAENTDLFWALCGGGGNFGIVTRWELRLHPVNNVFAGLVVFPEEERTAVLKQYKQYVPSLPVTTSVWSVMRMAPPLPFLPQDVHGKNVIILAFCHTGDPADGEACLEKLKSFGNPHGVHAGVMPFAAWQQAFDPLLTPGARNYWKSHNFTELAGEMTDLLVEYTTNMPHPETEVFIAHLEGHANTIAPDATAYSHRHTRFLVNMHGRWRDADDDDVCRQWTCGLFEATKPYAADGVYINFMSEDETERVKEGFGPNMERLARIKTQYDPRNVFDRNQNIKPA
ncbi:MAG: FAD-binding oxidoreductase [Verrucomicrobiales bacterium]